jgi:hypothetical protein
MMLSVVKSASDKLHEAASTEESAERTRVDKVERMHAVQSEQDPLGSSL